MVTLWTRNRGLANLVKDCLNPAPVTVKRPRPDSQPRTADAVVTTGSLGRETEMLAMRLGTGRIYVLPEAGYQLAADVETAELSTLAGADMGSLAYLGAV